MSTAETFQPQLEQFSKYDIDPMRLIGFFRTVLLEEASTRFSGSQVPAGQRLPGVLDKYTALDIATSCYTGSKAPYNEQVYAVLLGRVDPDRFIKELPLLRSIGMATVGIGQMLAELIENGEEQAAGTIFIELLNRRNQSSIKDYKLQRDAPLFSGFDKEWEILLQVSKVSARKAFEYLQLPASIVNSSVQTAVVIEYAKIEPDSYLQMTKNTRIHDNDPVAAIQREIDMAVRIALGLEGCDILAEEAMNLDFAIVKSNAQQPGKKYYFDHLSLWLIAYQNAQDEQARLTLERIIRGRYRKAIPLLNDIDLVAILDNLGRVWPELACELELDIMIDSIEEDNLSRIPEEKYSQLVRFMEDPNTYTDSVKISWLRSLIKKTEETKNPLIGRRFRLAELVLEYSEKPIQSLINSLEAGIDEIEYRALVTVLAPKLPDSKEANSRLLKHIQEEKETHTSIEYTAILGKAISQIDPEGRLRYIEQNISYLLKTFATFASGENGYRLKLFLVNIFQTSSSSEVEKLFRILIKSTLAGSGITEEFDLMNFYDSNFERLAYLISDKGWMELMEEYPDLVISGAYGKDRTLVAMLNLGLAAKDSEYDNLLNTVFDQLGAEEFVPKFHMRTSYIAQLLLYYTPDEIKRSLTGKRVGFLRTCSDLHSMNETLKQEDRIGDLPWFLEKNAHLFAKIQMIAPNPGVAHDFVVGTVRAHGFERLNERLELFETLKIRDINYWRGIFTRSTQTTAEDMFRLVEFYNIFTQIKREDSFWGMVENHDCSNSYLDLFRSLARTTLISMAERYGMPADKVDVGGLENWDLEYFSRIYFGAAKMAEVDRKLYKIVIKAGLMGQGRLKNLVNPRTEEEIDPEVFSQEEIDIIIELRRHNAIVSARLESYGISPDVFSDGVVRHYSGEISVVESIEMQAKAATSAVETLLGDLETNFGQEQFLCQTVLKLRSQINTFDEWNTSALREFSEQLNIKPITLTDLKHKYIEIVRQGFGSRKDKSIYGILEDGIKKEFKGRADSLVQSLISFDKQQQKNPDILKQYSEEIRILLLALRDRLAGQEDYKEYSDSINDLIQHIPVGKPIFEAYDVRPIIETIAELNGQLQDLKDSGRYSHGYFEFVFDHLTIADAEVSGYVSATANTKPIKYDFTIRRWSGEPGVDLVQGNHALNCTAIDSSNAFMVLQCLLALDIQPTVIYDNLRGRYVGLAYDFLSEIQERGKLTLAYNFDTLDLGRGVMGISQIARQALFEYGRQIVDKLNQPALSEGEPVPIGRIQIGPNYNDINVHNLNSERQMMRVITGPFLGLHRYLDMACMRGGGRENGAILERLNYAYWLDGHARIIEQIPGAKLYPISQFTEEIIKIDSDYPGAQVREYIRAELLRIRLEEEGAGVCAPNVDEIIDQLSDTGELLVIAQQLTHPHSSNRIVGYAATSVVDSIYKVSHLFISPYLGDEKKLIDLLERIINEARNHGCTSIQVPLQVDIESSVFIVKTIVRLGKQIQPKIKIPEDINQRNLSLWIDHKAFKDDDTQRPIVEIRFDI